MIKVQIGSKLKKAPKTSPSKIEWDIASLKYAIFFQRIKTPISEQQIVIRDKARNGLIRKSANIDLKKL